MMKGVDRPAVPLPDTVKKDGGGSAVAMRISVAES